MFKEIVDDTQWTMDHGSQVSLKKKPCRFSPSSNAGQNLMKNNVSDNFDLNCKNHKTTSFTSKKGRAGKNGLYYSLVVMYCILHTTTASLKAISWHQDLQILNQIINFQLFANTTKVLAGSN